MLRVGSTALQKSGYPLETHEQALAAAGALYGGLGVLRASRSVL